MNFLIAVTFNDSLAKLTAQEQKAAKLTGGLDRSRWRRFSQWIGSAGVSLTASSTKLDRMSWTRAAARGHSAPGPNRPRCRAPRLSGQSRTDRRSRNNSRSPARAEPPL